MAKTAATKAAMLNAYEAIAVYASFCTGDPGTTGANEGTAGRATVSWVTATDTPLSSGTVNVPCTPGVTYTHIALWTNSTGAPFADGYPLSASFTPAAGVTSMPVTFSEALS